VKNVGQEPEEAMAKEGLPQNEEDGGASRPGSSDEAGSGESAGLSAEEIDALTKGLDGLEAIGSKVPDIPDLEHLQNAQAGGEVSQSAIDDLIASIKESSPFNFEAPGGAGGGSPSVKPALFPEIVPEKKPGIDPSSARLGLLMDIPVKISVVLGRTQMTLGEIMALEPGGVVELEKLVGDPIEVLANGKLILRGEVVVIDENFGVRVTEIVDSCPRKGTPGKG
jgi:flagellar motor switch protein FliN/FliY